MPKQRGSANSEIKPTERRSEDEDYNPITAKKSALQKVRKEEYLIKNACYLVTKYYLCKQNDKRSLLGRKQRSQVARSFLNRYQFSCINKVTSLFSDRYIFIIILQCKRPSIKKQLGNYFTTRRDNTLSFLSIPLFYKTIQRKGYPSLSTVF